MVIAMLFKFLLLLVILVCQFFHIQALLCYSGEQSHGKWLRNLTTVSCRKSSFWCIMKRDLDPDVGIDRWVYGCTTQSLCESGINKNVRRKNAKGMSLMQTNPQLSEFDICCQSDLCNKNSAARTLALNSMPLVLLLFKSLFINY